MREVMRKRWPKTQNSFLAFVAACVVVVVGGGGGGVSMVVVAVAVAASALVAAAVFACARVGSIQHPKTPLTPLHPRETLNPQDT